MILAVGSTRAFLLLLLSFSFSQIALLSLPAIGLQLQLSFAKGRVLELCLSRQSARAVLAHIQNEAVRSTVRADNLFVVSDLRQQHQTHKFLVSSRC